MGMSISDAGRSKTGLIWSSSSSFPSGTQYYAYANVNLCPDSQFLANQNAVYVYNDDVSECNLPQRYNPSSATVFHLQVSVNSIS